jgi:HD domain
MATSSQIVLPALPDTPAARAALARVRSLESPSIANHSVRSYLFGMLLAGHRGVTDFDPLLLFFSCVFHDIGLTELGNRTQRFEVDGADVAAEFLAEQGFSAVDRGTVWEAIALHTSPGIAERRGPVIVLTRRGVGLDFGRDAECVSDEQATAIHAAYPRLSMERAVVDAIVAQARERPEKAPRYSIAAELLRERTTTGLTTPEQGAAHSRWGP